MSTKACAALEKAADAVCESTLWLDPNTEGVQEHIVHVDHLLVVIQTTVYTLQCQHAQLAAQLVEVTQLQHRFATEYELRRQTVLAEIRVAQAGQQPPMATFDAILALLPPMRAMDRV
jgi:hypothetical protein